MRFSPTFIHQSLCTAHARGCVVLFPVGPDIQSHDDSYSSPTEQILKGHEMDIF
jgi:hypothetical protein